MESVLSPNGLGYTFTVGTRMQPDLVRVEVSNIRSRAGSLYALLTTHTHLPEARVIPGTQQVLQAEVWLLSERSRSDYAKALFDRIPVPKSARGWSWDAMLDDLVEQVVSIQTQPDEIEMLNGNVAQQQPLSWLVAGVIPEHHPTILYGAGGSGKSILAIALAMAVQHGVPILGRPTQKREVLYLDWETDRDDFGRRMHAAAAGLGLTDPALRYSRRNRPLEDKVEQLASQVAGLDVGLVVIDSVGFASVQRTRDTGDPSQAALSFLASLRSLGTTVLAIDHISGEDMKRQKGAAKPYGSVYKWNGVRNAFELRVARPADSSGTHLLLKHRKSNIGPLLSDTPINLNWDDGAGVAAFGPDSFNAVTPLRIPTEEQILDIVMTGAVTPERLTDLLEDYAEMDVRRVLRDLVVANKLRTGADGAVRLVTD